MKTDLFIAGAWRTSDARFPLLDKFTGDTIAEISAARSGHVAEAVTHCRRAFEGGVPSPYQRSEILRRAADIMAAEADSFAATYRRETGFTHGDAKTEVARCIETLRLSAEEARRFDATDMIPISGAPGPEGRIAFVLRMPIGPVAAITPFNAPLNTVAHKVAPAIAAGNPVLLKPSSATPLCGAAIVDLLLRAGWPEGLIALVQGRGEVGRMLVAQPDIRFCTFTGSTAVGRAIQQAAGLRRTQLELGSISFTVLEDDADLDKAIPLIRGAAFRKAGQVCTSVQVVLAQDEIADAVTARLAAATQATRFGDPADPETFTGPMISGAAAEQAEARIKAAIEGGAAALVGGERDRSVLAPTLLAGATAEMDVLATEMFAPAVTILRYQRLDDAIQQVNATPYGLATGIFTRRLETALIAARRLRVGGLHINNTSSSRVDLMPYGGVKDSGFGREGPAYAMREMSEERLVTITP